MGSPRTGVVLSHASTVVGPLVTPTTDPHSWKAAVEAAQPGCVVTIVALIDGEWVDAHGRSPEQIIKEFS